MKKWSYVLFGFFAGCSYIYSCGGGNDGIATTLGNAIDVIYDNAESLLSATDVQTAVDELVTRIKGIENAVSADSVVGVWTGKEYGEEGESNVALTLNNDGSYSCTGTKPPFEGMCASPVGWLIVGKNLLIQWTGQYEAFAIQIVNSSTLSMLYNGENIIHLTK